jgi:uncharacterized Zn finger protein
MSSNYDWYPPSKPIEVEGGVKARSRRGAIGETWWSARFIAVLESMGMGGRLARGKNYARRGQVLDLWIEPGQVSALVQGSRRKPYRVRISLRAYDKAEWNKIVDALVQDAWYAAKLLAGELPEEIVGLFDSLGLALFPSSLDYLGLDCTCPDWEVPCKHMAAVFYLLAERFDLDPFDILAWRGRDRETLLDTLSARRVGTVPADRAETRDSAIPLTDCLDSYWSFAPSAPSAAPGSALGNPPRDAVLGQLPRIPLDVRGTELTEILRPAYLASLASLGV